MNRSRVRSCGVVCGLLIIALYVSSAPVVASPIPDADEFVLPLTIDTIWYRGERKPFLRGAKLTGDLTIDEVAIELQGRKDSVAFPMRSILGLSLGPMSGDADTEWLLLEVDVDGATALVGLRDGRKFGYGANTRRLYDLIKAVLQRLGAARYALPPGFEPFETHEYQFVFGIPSGWSSFELEVTEVDDRTRYGKTIFSAEPMATAAPTEQNLSELQAQLRRVHTGAMPAFIVDRRPAEPGMSCDGFSKRALPTLRAWAADAADSGKDGSFQFTEAESLVIGECQALRWIATAQESHDLFAEVYAVARSNTVVFFVRRTLDAADAGWFLEPVHSFRFAPGL